jgi:PAS domain-containing protein
MKKNQVSSADSADLRRRAEQRLQRQKPPRGGQRTTEETARLLHEPEVHQIELEMQNEELEWVRAQTEALLAQYTDLYDSVPVGYFTLARDGTILAINLAGAGFVGIARAKVVNRRLAAFIAVGRRVFESPAVQVVEVRLAVEGHPPLTVQIRACVSTDGRSCLAAVTDIAERKLAEEAVRQKNVELEATLAQVKTLSGVLPICATCKRIRDDKGYWDQVEGYLSKHTGATFTHGICPTCVKEHYGDGGRRQGPMTGSLHLPAMT